MSKKDVLSKEIDELLDEIKFWRNVLFTIISALVGIVFTYSQDKIKLSLNLEILIITGVSSIFIILFIIYIKRKEKYSLHQELFKED